MKHQSQHFAIFFAPDKNEKKLREYKKIITEACQTFYKKLINGERAENPYTIESDNEKILHIEKKCRGYLKISHRQ